MSLFFAPFASLEKQQDRRQKERGRGRRRGALALSPNYLPTYSFSHTCSVRFSLLFLLLLIEEQRKNDRQTSRHRSKERKERNGEEEKKKVDSHSFRQLHSVHMRQTIRHNCNAFHYFINMHDGKLTNRNICITCFSLLSYGIRLSLLCLPTLAFFLSFSTTNEKCRRKSKKN